MTTTPPPKRRTRRFLQFSLRSLLVFVLLVSISLSWLGVKLERARKQKEAVEAIGGLADVTYEDFGDVDPFVEPSVPKWARELFGDDFFFDVIYVSTGADFSDEEMAYLKRLKNLTILYVGGTQITDAGLEHLEGLTQLTGLDLCDTEITDTGLEHIGGLTSLTELYLVDTKITDTGLGHLGGLTNLAMLELNDTQVTDAGLEYLKGLVSLGYLDLSGTQATPEGVKKLQEALPECEIVYDE